MAQKRNDEMCWDGQAEKNFDGEHNGDDVDVEGGLGGNEVGSLAKFDNIVPPTHSSSPLHLAASPLSELFSHFWNVNLVDE